jgi:hypothetical protein
VFFAQTDVIYIYIYIWESRGWGVIFTFILIDFRCTRCVECSLVFVAPLSLVLGGSARPACNRSCAFCFAEFSIYIYDLIYDRSKSPVQCGRTPPSHNTHIYIFFSLREVGLSQY